MKNKIFTRIIITTLLCAFLTFSVGKVTRVSAVGTTAALAGTAFLLTGAVYLSYVALTQGQMILPVADDLHEYLVSIGRKVSQYSSGAAAYQDIYQGLLRDPTANVIDDVWTWTQERIKSFANDFSDTRLISDLLEYYAPADISLPTTDFDYPFDIQLPLPIVYAINAPLPSDFAPLSGARFIFQSTGYCLVNTNLQAPYRNIKNINGTYGVQQFVNGDWVTVTNFTFGGYAPSMGMYYYETYKEGNFYYATNGVNARSLYSAGASYPQLADAEIYDAETGEIIQTRVNEGSDVVPSWNDPDNDNRPIIPWVPIPQLPVNVPTPSGYNGISQWGFNLQDLLDKLEDLAGQLIDIGGIAALINEFAGLHGDNYYIEYNDGDTNYYTYYQHTIYDNDTEYITYNIDITDEQDKIPVDLNTIQLYTNNRYLAQIKESAVNGSTMLRDLAVFWYDVDPEVTYIVFGCCILVLIGAFTGKLGHS